MNKNVRLEKVSRRLKPVKPVVVFFYDYEGTSLSTKPCCEPGAQLVTPEELEKARKDSTVILVCYEEQKAL